MELLAIDTLDEFEIEGNPALLVSVRCETFDPDPPVVFAFAQVALESWGEEVSRCRIYSLERVTDGVVVGVRCEV